jgi:hypothetical protein
MTNEVIKREADELIVRSGLRELLHDYPSWFIGGSYSYDLMCWRDLDIYVLDHVHDLHRCFAVAATITKRLDVWKSRFTNNLQSHPKGYYWGLKFGNEREGAWKIDLWFMPQEDFTRHAEYSKRMKERLTEETRVAILLIKEAYWRRPEYRDTITSDDIYRAVLDDGVRSVEEFASIKLRVAP